MNDMPQLHPEDRCVWCCPSDAATARLALVEGNACHVKLANRCARDAPGDGLDDFTACTVSCRRALPDEVGAPPRQTPFAVVLSCADARTPPEMIFGQPCNSLFVIRVAGNVLGDECLGSIEFAVRNMHPTLRLLVVLGHSGCGAVTAAVDAYLAPEKYEEIACSCFLRSVIDRIFAAVRLMANAMEQTLGPGHTLRSGYRKALIEGSACVNAAFNALHLRQELETIGQPDIPVVYGFYDLVSRRVHVPAFHRPEVGSPSAYLVDAPVGPDDLMTLSSTLAASGWLQRHLGE